MQSTLLKISHALDQVTLWQAMQDKSHCEGSQDTSRTRDQGEHAHSSVPNGSVV